MRKTIAITVLLSLSLLSMAQTHKPKQQSRATATKVVRKVVGGKPTTHKGRPASDPTIYTNASIRGLQGQRAAIQKKIREQEAALRKNQADVKQKLQDLLNINSEIDRSQKHIEGIQKDIHHIEGNIGILRSQLHTLEEQLADRKAKYVKSMRYMARHRTVQDKMMFIFSAKSFLQMYRRLRFVREYAAYQKAQGEVVKAKQQQVTSKHKQLEHVKGTKNSLLQAGWRAKSQLETQHQEQQKVVQSLQSQQQTIQKIIAQQRQKDAALNAQIDRMVAIEVARARARAAAEAKKRAAAAAAAQKRAAELARKKAEAEAAARENARRIAEAKAREARLKAEAEAAARAAEAARKAQAEAAERARQEAAANAERAAQRAAAERAATAAKEAAERKAAAEQAAREAEAQRAAAELKAKVEEQRSRQEMADAKKEAEEAATLSTVDRMMNNGFEANRGRLPMPITGSYRVVSHFGQYNVEGLKGITLDNKGINIKGGPGCQARAIYDGEVSAVFGFSGTMVVMVRHGAYISVYCNLKSVNVHKGQRVSTRQALGAVGTDNILQFQLRKETSKLNPEAWLGR